MFEVTKIDLDGTLSCDSPLSSLIDTDGFGADARSQPHLLGAPALGFEVQRPLAARLWSPPAAPAPSRPE